MGRDTQAWPSSARCQPNLPTGKHGATRHRERGLGRIDDRSRGLSFRRSSTRPTTTSIHRGGAKKDWAPAFRYATMLKVIYACGLRRREVMLEVSDFGPNPKAADFGHYGVCGVRWGKSAKGGPPHRRGVLIEAGCPYLASTRSVTNSVGRRRLCSAHDPSAICLQICEGIGPHSAARRASW
jgi:hypothetical protein